MSTVARTDTAAVAGAWLGSLTTRDLAARSAFGSYVVLQHLPEHSFTPSELFHPSNCGTCGLRESVEPAEPTHPIRHTDIADAAADLAAFRPTPATTDDRGIFDAIRALPPTGQLTDLIRSLQGLFPANKLERTFLLEALGFAGILCPRDQSHYSTGFVTYDHANSTQPPERGKREWAYPVRWWTGADGVDDTWVKHYFA